MSNLSKDPDKLLVVLPWFPGFYNSYLDGLMDQEIESEMESTGQDWSDVDKRFSWLLAAEAITKGWVSAFSSETGIPMELESLKSPKFYNFSTDICFVLIPVEQIERIAENIKEETLRSVIFDRHSHRSGFCSFYSNDLDDPLWQKPVRDWDHNQLETLLITYLTQFDILEDELTETIEGTPCVYEAANHGWFTPEEQPV
jgi:hypothetical protein